jgi:hypothetical protein
MICSTMSVTSANFLITTSMGVILVAANDMREFPICNNPQLIISQLHLLLLLIQFVNLLIF